MKIEHPLDTFDRLHKKDPELVETAAIPCAALLAMLVMGGVHSLTSSPESSKLQEELNKLPPNTMVDVVGITTNTITVVLGEKQWKFSTELLSEEVKQSLIEQRPEFKAFLEGGPVKIFNPDTKK